ncbi:FtsK/SpoIIIE family DNA translocase [Phocaeicola massiliensis]|jgi:S-DNA-T family DNA segregation ATPase FtsK/SpoIIIE|uniref:FtsK/SpoIIIE family DNA translocase n=1 Tax=Phocaeicola massiliensis TaxID=204516 RepID=UPI00189C1961|nr:DNA translocase FtsK [Phocaeicola massiliensis]MCM1613542.1 DNA translocase FtsK [Phocaeicola massiliensis]MCM1704599.1 DNA translocase FtsK [Phocaeicola massiliensis]
MAKKKTDKETEPKKISKNRFTTFFKSETTHFVIGLISVIFSVYLLLAFISFFFTGAADQSILDNQQPGELMQTTNHVKNYAGARGAQLAEFLINECFGIAACFIILFLAVAGMKMIKAYQFRVWKWFMSCSILLVWFSITLGFIFDGTFSDSFIYPGGLHGHNVSAWLVSQIGMPGLGLLLLITALLFFVYLSSETINMIRKALHPNFRRKKKDTATATDNENNDTSIKPKREEKKEYSNPQPAVVDFELEQPMKVEVGSKEEEVSNTPFPFEEKQTSEPQRPMPTEANEEEEEDNDEPDFTVSDDTSEEDAEYKGPALQPYNPRLDLENYKFPTLDLLNQYEDNGPNIDMEEQNANKDRIIKVLRSFGIEISSIKASVGPTITLYEITPAEGVRISKIRNLEDDIALSLSALGIRIIAPIPGKGTIGIEVPNANPRIVPMQSILNSKKFQETTMELPIALGKTITNEVFMVDLAKAPHMLVAGATGQGKSVGLNAIVTSLLYKKHPAELKFVIVDPKKVEFSVYTPIERHFLAKLPDGEDAIITDVSKVVQTLNSLCIEMDTRYDLLRKAGCRNIKEYNAKFISRQLNPEKGHRFMPYIVIIIDEFGDLIMTAGKEVELPICRIAQLARAVGIHAIIATQRPTTNIITGTIKANFPARVAFRVAAMMDSRTILDRSGAQQLIGKGDMLYLQGNDPVRVQCAFVDTPEVERIANYISKQQGYPTAFMLPEYVGEESESSIGEVDMNRLDPMFEDAARLVVIHQQGSTSLIQRKFSIGYNRAGRIMDQLEKAGIVGPTQGSKARDVLCMDETDLEMKLNNLQQ